MPLPDTHTARQSDPGQCAEIRKKDIAEGIAANICVPKGGGASSIQSIHFDAKKFSVAEAKKWLKEHNFSAAEFEAATKEKADAAAVTGEMKDVSQCPMGEECPMQNGEYATACRKGVRPVNLAAEGLPAVLKIDAATGALEIQAASVTGGKRTFASTAYTGAAMRLEGFAHPVVIDLQGMKVHGQKMPILRQHDPERIVGYTDSVEVSAQRVRLTGALTSVTPAGQEALALAADGFPWQVSVGADVHQMEFVPKDEQAKCNGRNFSGPCYVARGTGLREASLVAMGADPGTSATVGSEADVELEAAGAGGAGNGPFRR